MQKAITKKIERSLTQVFGLEKLRPLQRQVIERVLAGHDVLAIMPTGGGKSLCYQLPGLHLPGMTLVISPLISLMKDQQDKLEEKGIDAAALNSSLPESEQREAMESVVSEDSDFIFATPERLTDAEFMSTLREKEINLVVIDEAHCISQWGHNFRPAFLEIKDAVHKLDDPLVLALTATATLGVIEDIKKQLARPKMEVVRGGVYRPNLHFRVLHTTNESEKREELERIVRELDGPKIVYCATVKAVDEVTTLLQNSGFDAESYHGKMSAKRRNEVQDRFMSGELVTIVATNAFGMGIDKPDIRAVIHWQMPGSLEAYYQEAGRAGRDGETAECILLYDTRDRRIQQYFLGGRYPTVDDVAAVYHAVREQPAVSLTDLQQAVSDYVSKSRVQVILTLLKDEKLIRERRGKRYDVASRNVPNEDLSRIVESYAERGMSDREKLERMMLYAQSGFCRWLVLDEYFDSPDELKKCGTCDNCVSPPTERLDLQVPGAQKLSRQEERRLLQELTKKSGRDGDSRIAAGTMVEIPSIGPAHVLEVDGDNAHVILPDGEKKTFKLGYLRVIRPAPQQVT